MSTSHVLPSISQILDKVTSDIHQPLFHHLSQPSLPRQLPTSFQFGDGGEDVIEEQTSKFSPPSPSASVLCSMCQLLHPIFLQEENVIRVESPVVLVGDIHGQYFDLLELLRLAGPVPDRNYIFMGDFVDRGYYSIPCVVLLMSLKLKYPRRVHLIRGNHESRQTSRIYGLYEECRLTYGSVDGIRVWKHLCDMFDLLPIAAQIVTSGPSSSHVVVQHGGGSEATSQTTIQAGGGEHAGNSNILAVHGGLSPEIEHLDQLKVLDRFHEVPSEGALADLLWSDPDPSLASGFQISQRGAGYLFAADVCRHFLHMNRLQHIARAHQLCEEGYQVLFNDQLSTVWSAPNYCYRCGNLASYMEVDDNGQRTFHIFCEAPQHLRHVPPRRKGKDARPEFFV